MAEGKFFIEEFQSAYAGGRTFFFFKSPSVTNTEIMDLGSGHHLFLELKQNVIWWERKRKERTLLYRLFLLK